MASTALSAYKAGQRAASGKRRSRRKTGFTLPIAPIAGLAVGMWPVVKWIMEGKYENARTTLIYNYTPYNPWNNTLDISGLKNGLFPLVGGLLVHKLVGQKMGLNRMLKSSGIPIIRL